MEANAIRDMLRAVPFRPFRMHLADGRVFTVTHPEWFLLAPNGRHGVLYEADSTIRILEPLSTVSLEFMTEE